MATVLSSHTPVARVPHTCIPCTGQITPGTKYIRSTLVYDGRMYTWKSCVPCAAIELEVWDWAYRPDEGVGADEYVAWAEAHVGIDEWAEAARAYLARRGGAS